MASGACWGCVSFFQTQLAPCAYLCHCIYEKPLYMFTLFVVFLPKLHNSLGGGGGIRTPTTLGSLARMLCPWGHRRRAALCEVLDK